MNNSLITFRSITPAQRAEMLLRKNGYYCSIGRTPKWMQEEGCGYSIRIRFRDVMPCVQLLTENRVDFKKIYLLRENGVVEEIAL